MDTSVTESVLRELNNDRRVTVREIADKFDFSVPTIHQIITQNLDFQNVCARWVPTLLSPDEKQRRVSAFSEFLRRWKKEGDTFLSRIITTDETWLSHFDPETKQQSGMWKRKGSPPPKKARVTKSAGKHMFIMFMDMRGMILTHAVPSGQTVNAYYYSKVHC